MVESPSTRPDPVPPAPNLRLAVARCLRRIHFALLRLLDRRVAWVDCGANTGAVLEAQVRWFPAREYHAFEANPNLIPSLRAVADRHPATRIAVHHAAVWTADATLPFYLSGADTTGREDTEGSTLLGGKTRRNAACGEIRYDEPVHVPCVDFSAWLGRTFGPRDCVWLKMDIEGAEYEVLEKMLADGTIDRVDKAFVEFHFGHAHEIPGVDRGRHERLIAALSQRTRLVVWY